MLTEVQFFTWKRSSYWRIKKNTEKIYRYALDGNTQLIVPYIRAIIIPHVIVHAR